MTSFKNIIGMGISALAVISMPAMATTTPAATHPAAAASTAMKAKPAVARTTTARTATAHATTAHATATRAVPATHPVARAAAAHPNGRMVQARLSNGQVVTYNCSLPGNQTKQACKS